MVAVTVSGHWLVGMVVLAVVRRLLVSDTNHSLFWLALVAHHHVGGHWLRFVCLVHTHSLHGLDLVLPPADTADDSGHHDDTHTADDGTDQHKG